MYATVNVTVVKWNDNAAVCLPSDCGTVSPTGTARRWSAAAKSKVDVIQPKFISCYNKHMGGVDRYDRFLSQYRPMVQSKKWW